ncbi:MAG: hypothetical protein ACO3FK_04000 [Vulcanococcus sp.]
MTLLRTRYALQRADGLWFTHPTDTTHQWCNDFNAAHLWVGFQNCIDAAYTHNKEHEGQLRSNRVWVRELLITPDGQRLQVQGVR